MTKNRFIILCRGKGADLTNTQIPCCLQPLKASNELGWKTFSRLFTLPLPAITISPSLSRSKKPQLPSFSFGKKAPSTFTFNTFSGGLDHFLLDCPHGIISASSLGAVHSHEQTILCIVLWQSPVCDSLSDSIAFRSQEPEKEHHQLSLWFLVTQNPFNSSGGVGYSC